MYAVSNDFMTAVEEPQRTIKTKCVFNGSVTLTGDDLDGCIVSIEVTGDGEAGSRLSVGSATTAEAKISIRMPSAPLPLINGTVEPYIGLLLPNNTIEYCPLGFFYITGVTSSDDWQTVDIEAHDGMSRLTANYVPAVTLPCTVEDVVDDIVSQFNLQIGAFTFPVITVEKIYEGTARETLGWMAGLMGMNAGFNRDNELIFWYYDTSSPVMTIDRDIQYMRGVKRLPDDVVIQSIISGTRGSEIVSGNGYGMSSPNPYMTQTQLDAIAEDLIGISYSPLTVDWRGNPAIEVGDVVSVVDKDGDSLIAPVMTIRLTSTMQETIKAKGETEATFNLSKSPTEQKLQQVYSALQAAIAEASQLINGARGGIFRVTDSDADGVNDGWLISNSPNLSAATNLIKANYAGIGLSTDGGATYRTAMTASGINADVITTGQLNAERVSITGQPMGDFFSVEPDGHGHYVLSIGSSANDIRLKEMGDRIAFCNANDDELAYFSNNALEIVDLNRLRIGSLAIVTQSNGSVSFVRGDN